MHGRVGNYMKDIKTLVKNCIAGKRKSQKALYEQFAPKMLGVCIRYARDKVEAEDFLQEGFVKIFEHLHNLQSPEQLEAWMRKIMINTALEHLRKQKPHLGKEVEISDDWDFGIEESVTSEMSREELLELIQDLPPGFRFIFNMYAIEGYSHKEIGEMMNISEGTSKSQYARAKKLLQEKVEKVYQTALNVRS